MTMTADKPDYNLMYYSTVSESSVIRVTGALDPRSIANAIDHAFRANNEVVARAIGAGAVNQTVKGIAIARGVLAPRGVDMFTRIGFADIDNGNGETRTAIVFRMSLG